MDRALLKANARRQLGGGIFSENWLLGLVVVMISGALVSVGSSVLSGITGSFHVGSGSASQSFSDLYSGVMAGDGGFSPELFLSFFKSMVPSYSVSIGVGSLVNLLVGGPIAYGVCKVFLDLVMSGEKVKIETVFSGFRIFGETFVLGFMVRLFTFLWSLLFIIPGIIKSYAYTLAYYVKIDHPEYDWRACMKESERLMRGYKFSYFVLHLSFAGWFILGAMVCGVGTLWVLPYVSCTEANFYAWRIAQDGAAGEDPFNAPA